MRNYEDVLLDPSKCTTIIIDHQPQMYFGVESHSRKNVENNVVGLAKAAQVFEVPTIITTVEATTFSGQLMQKLQPFANGSNPIDRQSINAWEDENLKKAVEDTNRKTILIAGLWTEACVLFPVLTMKHDGYDVYIVTDACGGATNEAHDMAIQRMIQAGVKPVTWLQVMLEWQRSWANKDTYEKVMQVIKDYAGAYGLGVEYVESMVKK